ncbi:MAG: NEW3 domain-containing protein [Haloferacaceae archaeon]
MSDRPRASLLALALLVVLAPAAAATPVVANTVVVGSPEVSVASPTGPVQASERTTLRVVVTNAGTVEDGAQNKPDYEQQVTTARNVRVRIDESRLASGIDVKTGTVSFGRLPSPASEPVDFALEVGNVSPGRYRVPVVVEYGYIRSINYDRFEQPEFTDTTETVRTSVVLVVEDRPQFAVVSEGANRLFAGDTGTLAFTVKNTGTRTARRASVRLSTGSPGLFFGPKSAPQESSSLYVDALEPGETRRLTAKVGASGDAAPGTYPITASISFRNQNGVLQTADTIRTGVTVRPERTFEVRDLRTARFRVDESEARVTGRIVNTGEGTARNVAVQLRGGGPITATNGEAAVGDLAPGEAARVNFTVTVAADAEPGTNTVRFGVEYENAAGELRALDDPLRRSLTVGPERAPFRVVGVSTDLAPGGSARLDVRVRYVGDEPVDAVNAKLFASDPLSSSDDGAYLGHVAPGATRTATFRVSAGGKALAKEYDAAIEIRYDEADGDTRFTDSLPIGVPVRESGGGLPLPLLAGVVLLVLGAAGYVGYRRR